MSPLDQSTEIIRICKKLHRKNFLSAADGNVSVLAADGRIMITPSGINKDDLEASQLAVLDQEGAVLHGQPSSERLMHLAVFKNCPKAKAIVHAHPPTAVAWSIARPDLKELPAECMSELILAVGAIPIVPYARPGTAGMGQVLAPYLPAHRVMILARHGALSWGETLEEAYNGIERLEHSAMILMNASLLGGLHPLAAEEVAALRELRKKLGDRTL